MQAVIVTTITTHLDLDSMESRHVMEIDDQDGLSEVSSDVLGALLLGALGASRRAVREQFPRAGQAEDRTDTESETDS